MKILTLAVLALLWLPLVACQTTPAPVSAPVPVPAPAPPATGSGTNHQVNIQNFAFDPPQITIEAGDTVTWTNLDSAAHTATGDTWDSGNLGKGQTYTATFGSAGTNDYICRYHPNMKGRVMVE